MTFCHFASDILNMLSLTFVSSLVGWVLNKAELLGEIQRESTRKGWWRNWKGKIKQSQMRGRGRGREQTDKGRWTELKEEDWKRSGKKRQNQKPKGVIRTRVTEKRDMLSLKNKIEVAKKRRNGKRWAIGVRKQAEKNWWVTRKGQNGKRWWWWWGDCERRTERGGQDW